MRNILICWHLPIRTASESNSSEHWTVKNKRHARQKGWINTLFKRAEGIVKLPCTVTLTRIAPRALDEHDNLRVSFKWIADAIASNLIPGKAAGRADDSKEITWQYKQERGNPHEYGIRIELVFEENFTENLSNL